METPPALQPRPPAAPLRIALLVPTFRRPQALAALLDEVAALQARYAGRNRWQLVVTDSERDNPRAAAIAARCAQYLRNPGEGFDDNLLAAWAALAPTHDWVFSISDDDRFDLDRLPGGSGCHPWERIDAALAAPADPAAPWALLFDHRGCERSPGGEPLPRARYYGDAALAGDLAGQRRLFLGLPPRHAGLALAGPYLQRCLPLLAPFRGSLHLYVVPFLLALAEGRHRYVDHSVVLFHDAVKADGAWAHGGRVVEGLLQLLAGLAELLPTEAWQLACAGFWANFLGPGAWLRRQLAEAGCTLPPSEDALAVIEACVARLHARAAAPAGLAAAAPPYPPFASVAAA